MKSIPTPIEPRRAWVTAHANAKELDLIARDERVSFKQANSTPALMSVAEAEGIWIWDVSGNKYRDFYGNNCHHVGYQHPKVVQRVKEQLERLCFVSRGLTSEPSIHLAEKLLAHYPGPTSKVLFVPGGAAAVEVALMIAKVHTGRFKTVSFEDSYHGRSAGALSVGGSPRDKSPRMGPLMPGALHAPPFYWDARKPGATKEDLAASARSSFKHLRALFERERDIAALIAEPIRNGPYIPPHDYWTEVRKLCDQYGTVLIFDDIPMGLGKTGRLFNCEHFGVKPDITLLGKALGGAIAPLAAVIADTRLDTTGEFNLSYYTHEKNPLSTAAGLATLSVIIDEKLPERARSLGTLIGARLEEIRKTHRIVANVRSIGLIFAIDFDGSEGGRTGADRAREAYLALLHKGVLAMPPKAQTLSFSAPLVIEEGDLSASLEILDSTTHDLK